MTIQTRLELHSKIPVILTRITELEKLIASGKEAIQETYVGYRKYHPHYSGLRRSYQRAIMVREEAIQDLWREYYLIMEEINQNPVRKIVKKVVGILQN